MYVLGVCALDICACVVYMCICLCVSEFAYGVPLCEVCESICVCTFLVCACYILRLWGRQMLALRMVSMRNPEVHASHLR